MRSLEIVMEMKRFFIHFIWLSILCSSCGMGSSERERLTAERDSLAQEAAAIREELDGLKSYVDEVSECVDSISQSEGVLMINRDPETGRPYTRRELRERVKNFASLVERQRNRIALLTDSLRRGGIDRTQMKKLMAMVDYLNEQLEAKEAQLNKLRDELAISNRNIAQLSEDLTMVRNSNIELSEENAALNQTVSKQAERINEAYFLAADKERLEKLGLLKGGFLKKSQFVAGNINLNSCEKIDIRNFEGIIVNSKKPKLLTQAPAGSYTFEKVEKGKMRFVILDREAFWSLSNVAIVQL